MIKSIQGDNVSLTIDEFGISIRAENQVMVLHDESWMELVKFAHIIRAAAREHDQS